MDENVTQTSAGQETVQLTDKDLHCIARQLQSVYVEGSDEHCMHCLYCKYAFQCREKFVKKKIVPYLEALEKLKCITGVDIRLIHPGTICKNILDGSWIEKCPKLLEKFTSISLEEQHDILQNPDILLYKDSCSPQI